MNNKNKPFKIGITKCDFRGQCLLKNFEPPARFLESYAFSLTYAYAYYDSMRCEGMRRRDCFEYYACYEMPRCIF